MPNLVCQTALLCGLEPAYGALHPTEPRARVLSCVQNDVIMTLR